METANLRRNVRAREVEEQMTDDERFSLVISLIGGVPLIRIPREKRMSSISVFADNADTVTSSLVADAESERDTHDPHTT
jgi:hypothetical protein